MSAFKIIEYPSREVYKSKQGSWQHRPTIKSNTENDGQIQALQKIINLAKRAKKIAENSQQKKKKSIKCVGQDEAQGKVHRHKKLHQQYVEITEDSQQKRQSSLPNSRQYRKKSMKSSINKEKSKQQPDQSKTPHNRCYDCKGKKQQQKGRNLQYHSLPSIHIKKKGLIEEKMSNASEKGHSKTLDYQLLQFESAANNPQKQAPSLQHQSNQNRNKLQSYKNQENILLIQIIQSKINNTKREINPLKLKTYFRIQRQRELDRQKSEKPSIEKQNKKHTIPKIPHISKVSNFIKSYAPKTNIIKMPDLIQQANFGSILQGTQTGELKLYFGQISNEQMHGTGIMITKDYIFEGTWINNQKIKGLQITQNGIYKGEFSDNERNGQGQFFWTHGDYFIGSWKNGRRNGNGYWKSDNGQSYFGNWIDGQLSGEGSKTQKDGSKYQGQFQSSQKHGFGKEIFSNGDKYQGLYRKGLPHGRGEYTWKQGFVYEGTFQEGLKHGDGRIMGKNLYKYSGKFEKDGAVGTGSIKYSNGDTYQGEMNQNMKNGLGLYSKKSEKIIIKGFWKDDKLVNIQEQKQH